MLPTQLPRRILALFLLTIAGAIAPAWCAEIHVLVSGAFTAAYQELVPEFERASGHKVITAYGASMGGAPDSIPSRLDRGEQVDVVILAVEALEALAAKDQIRPHSRVDLVRSSIGLAVKTGTPHPDITSVEALKRTLLGAKSIAYSASASGTYLFTELFPRLGIAEEMKLTAKRIESERVGVVVARGDAELGFQQKSELLPIAGIEYVGPLPDGAQRETVFSAGTTTTSKQPEVAWAFSNFFTSKAAAPVITRTGLDPLTSH